MAIIDEWAILTENEVKRNLYLKKLFKVVSGVRFGDGGTTKCEEH